MSPPGKKIGMDDVRVGRDDEPAVAEPERRAVVHRRGADPVDGVGRRRHSFRKTSSMRARIARPPAPCFSVTRSSRSVEHLHSASPRSGMPPYWCQILQVPSLETMQAPTGVSGTHSRAEERAVVRGRDARHDVAADAARGERRRRVVPERGQVDREAPARVDVRPLVAQPQVAVRDVRDAAPAAADRAEDAPELLLRAQVALARDAAREHVDDPRRPVADELHQAREAGEDVERLEARDDDRDPVALDEGLEDAPAGDRGGVAGREEPLDARLRHLGDDLHHRAGCTCARRAPRSSAAAAARHDGRGRDGGRLEPGREEDDLLRSVSRASSTACAAL